MSSELRAAQEEDAVCGDREMRGLRFAGQDMQGDGDIRQVSDAYADGGICG